MKNKNLTKCYLLVLVLSLTTACKKISAPDEASKSIFSTWGYQSQSGGFSGFGGGNQFNENSSIKFTEKGIYKVFEGTERKDKRHFKIAYNSGNNSLPYKVVFKNANHVDYAYGVHADTLILSENVADGYLFVFVRK